MTGFRRSRPDALHTRAWWPVAGALAAMAVLWAAAIPLAALTIAGDGTHLFVTAAQGVFFIGHFICHQLPERSFAIGDTAFPVCARCTGIYAGAAVGAAVACAWRSYQSAVPGSQPATARVALAGAVALNLVTLLAEWAAGVSANPVRAAAGGVLGVAASWVVLAFVVSDTTGARDLVRAGMR